jgi:uncharacterized protein
MNAHRLIQTALVLTLASSAAPAVAAPKEVSMPAPIVFFDIAAPDLASQAAFYKAVFSWEVDAGGGFSVPVASPLPGNLRVEAATQGPVTERVIYIGVPDITAALAQITAHGGSVVFPRLAVPGVVILALFKDPAGNRMGLVELDGDKPKIPPKG